MGVRSKNIKGYRRSETHQQVTKSHVRMEGWNFTHKMQNLSMIRKILDFRRPGIPQKVGRIPSLWLFAPPRVLMWTMEGRGVGQGW